MLQSFTVTARPDQGPPRLALLRAALARAGLDGFLVPRADAHQGEYVAPCDARLEWLTGFTGSAGVAVVLADRAALFVDGRYRVQAQAEVDTAHLTPVDGPETGVGEWLAGHAPEGAAIGFDPWLHTDDEIGKLRQKVGKAGLTLRAETLRANARQVSRLKPFLTAMAEAYPQLQVPVEIVHGTADRIVSHTIHAEAMAKVLPRARLTLLDGVGHMPHHAAPGETVAAIRRAVQAAR